MRNIAAVFAALTLVSAGFAQNRTTQYTHPRLPESAELDRVNLKVGFSTVLPIEGKRDGIATMQLVDDLLIVQLRSGVLAVYDAATGTLKWSVRPGQPYPPVVQNVAVDDRYIIAARDVRLFAFNRTGGQSEWMYELPTIPSSPPASDGDRLFITISGSQCVAFELPERPDTSGPKEGMISNAKTKPPTLSKEPEPTVRGNVKPAASGTLVSTTAGRAIPPSLSGGSGAPSISVLESVNPPFRLNSNMRQNSPSMAVLPSAVPPFKLNSDVQATPDITVVKSMTRVDELSQKNLPILALKKAWQLTLGVRVSQTPVVTSGPVIFASTGHDVIGGSRAIAQENFKVETTGVISADLGQNGDWVFVPTFDANMLAIESVRGRIMWRFTADSAIVQRPAAVGNDIVIVTVQGQLYLVKRENGETGWHDSTGNDRFVASAKQFVAANDRYIYALDTNNQMLVIDRARGTSLYRIDTHDYTYALANDETDRVYLASNSGALVCLHDRANPMPKRHPKMAATSVGGDSAADLFKPAGSIKPRTRGEPPKPREDKPKEDIQKDDKPKDDKPKDNKKGKKDMPKDDN